MSAAPAPMSAVVPLNDAGGEATESTRFQELLALLSSEHERTEQQAELLRQEISVLRAQVGAKDVSGRLSSIRSTGRIVSETPSQLFRDVSGGTPEPESPLFGATLRKHASITSTSHNLDFVLKSCWATPTGTVLVAEGDRPMMSASLYALSMKSSSFMDSPEFRSGQDANQSRCIIRSNCAPRLAWDIMGLFLITYDIIAIPLMVFDLPPNGFTIFMDWFTLCFWTGDMFQSFFLDFYEKGQRVRDHKRIIKRYMRTWFLVDVLVVVPDWLMSILDQGGAGDLVGLGRVLRAARAVRMLRLLRLLKLQKILNAVYDMIDSEYTFIVLDLCRLLTFILVLNHVIACAWFLVGELSKNAGELNWLQHSGYSPAAEASPTWQYTTSLHWSLTQFTPASMDVNARNVPERIFSIIVLFFALVAFGTIVGSVTGSMTALRNMKGDSVKQFWLLRRYLKQRKVSADLKERIMKFLEFREEQKGNQVQESSIRILGGLSQPLHKELTHEMYMPCLNKHPFLKYISEVMNYIAFRICTQAVKSACYASNDVVFCAGEEAESMYVIKKGPFFYEIQNEQGISFERLPSHAWAAEAVLWTQWRHRGELKSHRPGDLLAIDPDNFSKVMSIHPRPWHFAHNYGKLFVNGLNNELITSDIQTFDFLQDTKNGYSEEVSDCDAFQPCCSRTSSPTNHYQTGHNGLADFAQSCGSESQSLSRLQASSERDDPIAI